MANRGQGGDGICCQRERTFFFSLEEGFHPNNFFRQWRVIVYDEKEYVKKRGGVGIIAQGVLLFRRRVYSAREWLKFCISKYIYLFHT